MSTEPSTQKPAEPAAGPAPTNPQGGFDAALNAHCVQALQLLRAGLSQALLYSAETKQFEKAAENACAPFTAVLDAIGDFTLSIAHGDALINSTRVEMPAAARNTNEQLEKVFTGVSVSSLQVGKGLTAVELGAFLQLMARKKLGSTDGAKINQNLREKGITHIQTGELRWVAIGAEQKVVGINEAGGQPGVANSMAQTAAGGAVDSFIRIAQRVEDPVAREQLRAEITEQLLQKDPGMLGNLLATATEHLKDPGNEPHRAVVALPQRDGQLLSGVLQLAKTLADKGALQSAGCTEDVRQLLAQLTAPYRSRAEDILPTVKFDPAVVPLLPEWLVQAHASLQGGSAAERVAGILTQSPNALLDERMFSQIVDVLDELSVAGMDAEAEQLMKHVSGALRTVTKASRRVAVQRLSFLLERSMEQVSNAVKALENALLDACTHETCDEVMQLLLAHLSKRCVHHYQLGNFQRAQEHLRWITSLEESSRLAMRAEGANLAKRTREELAKSDFAKRLVQDLLAPEAQGKAAQEMATALGKDLWGLLIERIRNEVNPDAAAALALQLKAFGKEAVQLFFALLSKEQDAAGTLRLLALAPAMGEDETLAGLLPPLLRHPSDAVRARALELARHRGEEHAVKLLIAVLHEETDAARRKELIYTLARSAHASALEALLAELEAARNAAPLDDELLLTLLEALNAMNKQEVIPEVSKLLASRGRTMVMTADQPTGPSKAVQVAAIKTLARFFQKPVVVDILERLRKDRDPEISRLAVVALRGIIAAESKPLIPEPAIAAAPAPAPVAAPPAAGPPKRKVHRAFEALEEQMHAEKAFQVGAGLGAAPQGASQPAPGDSGKSLSQPWLKGLTPSMEGQLQEVGLAKALQMLAVRDGVLRLDAPGGAAYIFIKGRKIVNIAYAGRADMEALALICELRSGDFAYFAGVDAPQQTLGLDVAAAQEMVNTFRSNREARRQ